MPDFPAYTKDELIERGRSLLITRRRGIDVTYGSDYDLWARMLGTLAWGEQKRAEALLIAQDPRRASGAYLAAYAAELAVGRDLTEVSTAATKAKGQVLITSAGAGGDTLPAGTVLRHADGTEYTLDAAVTTPTSAAASKAILAGHLSSESRIYQGHTGAGFVSAAVGEVYRASTGELMRVRAVDNHVALTRWLVDFEPPLREVPKLHDAFAQQRGVVGYVTAKEPGERGNKDPGDALSVLSPVGTIRAEAPVVSLTGGAEAMQPAEVRAAIAALLSERAPTGTLEDIRALALEASGHDLSECYVLPALGGISTYTLLPVRADGQYLGQADRDALVAYVSARLSPVDKFAALAVYERLDTRIDVLNVAVSELYAPDFPLPDETQPGIALSAATVSTVTLSVAVPAILIGARVIVTTRGASGAYIVVRRVVAISGQVLTLDAPLPFPPDIGAGKSYLTPGGALASQVVDALYAAYGAQAPGSGTSAAPRLRYPESIASDEPEGILRTVSEVEGVIDVAFTSGAEPDLSQPGGVLVPACTIRMYL